MGQTWAVYNGSFIWLSLKLSPKVNPQASQDNIKVPFILWHKVISHSSHPLLFPGKGIAFRKIHCFIWNFTHCTAAEFKTALWQCDVHDFDVIVELSVEWACTQYRPCVLSVARACTHLRTLHSKSHWWMLDRTRHNPIQDANFRGSGLILQTCTRGSTGSLGDHKFQKLIFIGTLACTSVMERPQGRVFG